LVHDSFTGGRTIRAALLLVVVLAVGGCASSKWVTLRKTPQNPLAEQLKLLSFGGPKPTTRTIQLLRRYDLAEELSGDRRQLLSKLHKIVSQEPNADTVYAIAELAYLGGHRGELKNKQVALDLYGASVLHSYLYLFDPQFSSSHNPYDPLFRSACDLYNTALENTLRIVRSQGTLRPGHACTIQTASRQIDLEVVVNNSQWHAEDFDHFEFISDYQVNGLRNHFHEYGLGVPLIAIRKQHVEEDSTKSFYPPQLSFPVTAFLRLEPSANSMKPHSSMSGEPVGLRAVLELHDPLLSSEVTVAGQRVPLESDVTTPLAYFLSQPEFDDIQMSTHGLFHPDAAKQLSGLYLLEPFQADKIPVVMVHGLWSSPVTWMEMFNDLRSSPEIRRHYQFWFYLYPTGQPFWFSAAQMREDLARARAVLDPDGTKPALDQMVLIGHSMGGLISKLQTVDSGDQFWNILTDQSFDTLQASPEIRNTLSRTLFFQPNPSVRRVITIGTPHRGSNLSNDATRWLSQRFITIPSLILQGQQLQRLNPGFFRDDTLLDITTSIDSLDPDSPLLSALLVADRAPWVSYHNIVGQVREEGLFGRMAGSGDGVVSARSAHLDASHVESEITVPADHTRVHQHPRTILEVRRILLEHVDQLRSRTITASHIQRSPLPVHDPAAGTVANKQFFSPP